MPKTEYRKPNRHLIYVAVVSLFLSVFLLSIAPAKAVVYNDAVGDEAFAPLPHLDIVSVEVMNDANDIMFTINLSGDPIATDWGKYLIALDSVAGGDTAGNGWGRPISMSSGMDYFIGSWVDWDDGAEIYSWDGAQWNLDEGLYGPSGVPVNLQYPAKTTSSVTLSTTLASLGLGTGDTFVFDVWTTGGGGTDSAIDALSDPSTTIANWDDPYNSTSELSYTVAVPVPEPATLSLFLISFGAMGYWRFRRR